MQRSHLLLVAVGLLVLLTAGLLWWNGAEPTAPDDPLDPAGQAAPPAPATASPGSGGTAPAAGSRERQEVAGGPLAEGSDPAIQEALTGFRGRVLDPAGEPVADCGVRLDRFALDSLLTPALSLMGEEPYEPQFLAGEARTDDQGRFTITGVWPRAFYLLRAGLGTDAPTHRIVERNPAPGEVVDLGDIVLESLAVFTGIAVDDEGRPVADAWVRAADLPGQMLSFVPVHDFDPRGYLIVSEESIPITVLEMPSWVGRIAEQLPIPQTTTGSDGRFRLVGIHPGNNVVTASKPGHVAALEPIVRAEAGKERDLGELVLDRGIEIFGEVVDAGGEPVPGAEVIAGNTLLGPVPVDFARSIGTTDEQGRFRARGFRRGRATVAARRGPGHSWVRAEPVSVDADIVVTLPSSLELEVAVRSEGGQPIEDPELRIAPGERDGGPEMLMLGFTRPLDLGRRLQPPDDDRPGVLTVTGLQEGHYLVLGRAAGHGVGSASVHLTENTAIELTLPPRRVHLVRVVGPEGQPIRNAAIHARERGRDELTEMPMDCGRTGPQGRLAIDELPGERIVVSASHPAWGVVHGEHSIDEPELVLTMQTPGAIEGVLLDEGQPPELGKWTIAAEHRRGRGVRGPLAQTPQLTTPDHEGRFLLRGLQPGTYRLHTIPALDGLRSPGALMRSLQSAWTQQDLPEESVEVPPGETVSVRMDTGSDRYQGPGANVSGSVMLNGAPGEGLIVTARGRHEEQVHHTMEWVDERGRFGLGRVPPGELTVQVIDASGGGMFGSTRRQQVFARTYPIEAGLDRDLMIEIETSSVSGRVLTMDGALPKAGFVELEGEMRPTGDDEQGQSVRQRTDLGSDGRFHFERVPAGRFSVTVEVVGEPGAKGSLGGIEVESGLDVTGLEVRVEQAVAVSGRIDLGLFGDEPPRGLWTRWERLGPEGEELDSSGISARRDGTFTSEELLPGRYRVRIYAWGGADLGMLRQPGEVRIGPKGAEGLVLVPEVIGNEDR